MDLLYAAGDGLVLVELKVEEGRLEFVDQIRRYVGDLKALQEDGRLISAPILPVLLCPSFRSDALRGCETAGIQACTYSPEVVLEEFFRSLGSLADLVGLRPTDLGLWNIHLIHRALYAMHSSVTAAELAAHISRSDKTVGNHLRLARELCLVEVDEDRFRLSALGFEYVQSRNPDMPPAHLSEEQAVVLRAFIVTDPFATSAIFGIYSMIETVFVLARNGYPVPYNLVIPHFRDATGKRFDWAADKTAYHGTHMYSNYGVELGLLGRSGEALFLTPEGIRFILLLQLHKSLKMIDVVGLGRHDWKESTLWV